MKQKAEATFQTIIELRTPKKDGTYPLKLRVTHNRIQRYYTLDIDISKEDFDKVNAPRPKEPFQSIKLKITSLEQKASDIIDTLSPFSFEIFKDKFNGKTISPKDVYNSINAYITKLEKENRHGSANAYRCTLNSLSLFKPLLSFNDITPQFLEKYEAYMLAKNLSPTTIGIYVRSLRTIINEAIEKQIIPREKYPFGKNKYQIPSGRNIKKAINMDEIKKIFNYEAISNSMEEKAKDFWMMSYLMNGMNMKDLCSLKFKDMSQDKIVFVRAKTQRTKKADSKPIVVMLQDETIKLIKKYSKTNGQKDDYIFNVISINETALEQRKRIHQFIKQVNKYMKRIASNLEIEIPLTTYVARHTFSTVLKHAGASTEFISESLGHSNLSTTESYLASFEDSTKKEFAKALLNFK
jgi:integrase/recombinase XerD